MDDGSTDGTADYLESLAGDPRFEVITFPENSGRPFARQAALELAQGKYLAFLDADDFYHRDKIAKQVQVLERSKGVDLVSCGNASFDNGFQLRTVRGCGDDLEKVYHVGLRIKSALRTSMIRMDRAKISFSGL